MLRRFIFCEDEPFVQEHQILAIDGWLKVRRRTCSLRGAYATRCEASCTCTSQITEQSILNVFLTKLSTYIVLEAYFRISNFADTDRVLAEDPGTLSGRVAAFAPQHCYPTRNYVRCTNNTASNLSVTVTTLCVDHLLQCGTSNAFAFPLRHFLCYCLVQHLNSTV